MDVLVLKEASLQIWQFRAAPHPQLVTAYGVHVAFFPSSPDSVKLPDILIVSLSYCPIVVQTKTYTSTVQRPPIAVGKLLPTQAIQLSITCLDCVRLCQFGSLDLADWRLRSREPNTILQWQAIRSVTATCFSVFCYLTGGVQESQASRPQSQYRNSMSSTPSHNLPIRHSTSRHHSHSVSLGAINPSHRVTRRKSMTSTAVNNAAAIAAALNGTDDKSHGASILANRHSLTLKHNGNTRANDSMMADNSVGLMGRSGHVGDRNADHGIARDESAIDDSVLAEENNGNISKARSRRASEGAHLSKSEGKRASGELRCDKCGKGYKHSSCLTKHLSVCPSSISSSLSHLGSTIFSLSHLASMRQKHMSCRRIFDYHWSPFVDLILQMGAYT